MRLWSLHPKYLDARSLVPLWREALLAQAVLAGRTRRYTNHPQLQRLFESPQPHQFIAAYLVAIYAEAARHAIDLTHARSGAAQGLDVCR
jgi:hypothetical protein